MHTSKQVCYPNRRRRRAIICARKNVRTAAILNIITERCLNNPRTYTAVIPQNEIIWKNCYKFVMKYRRKLTSSAIVKTSEGIYCLPIFSQVIIQNSANGRIIKLSLNPELADFEKSEVAAILKSLY